MTRESGDEARETGDVPGPRGPDPHGGWFHLPALVEPRRRIGRRDFDFGTGCAVMAIVNRTPDSFYDRGTTSGLRAAVDAALRAEDDGADWIDIGGVPFSPDTPAISAAEEIDRVAPVVAAVAERSDVVISVDTTRGEVASAVVEAGASVLNDTNGLRDPSLLTAVAASEAHVVIAHSLAAPHQHLRRPQYQDVTTDVATFLRRQVALAREAGIPDARLVIDPGPDLNKNTRHSLELLRRFDEITAIGLPTLIAVSNKDLIGETLGRGISERVPGSLAATVAAVAAGGRIVRCHNVPETVDAVRMTEAILGLRKPLELQHNA